MLLALAFVMLIMAMRRKRLFLGMAMALYGLTVFNLHYWGFGIPFILFASWYLVRSYRLSRDLRLATEGAAWRRTTATQQALHPADIAAEAPATGAVRLATRALTWSFVLRRPQAGGVPPRALRLRFSTRWPAPGWPGAI